MRGPRGLRGLTAAERGSLSLEAVLLMPVVSAFFLFAFAVGIKEQDQGVFDSAVQAAARTASLQRNPSQAAKVARATAVDVIQNGALQCTSLNIKAALTNGPYNEFVHVWASCGLNLASGLPFAFPVTVHSDFLSVVDTYRGQG